MGDGGAEGSSATGDGGQAGVSPTPDIDRTHVGIFESSQSKRSYVGDLLDSNRGTQALFKFAAVIRARSIFNPKETHIPTSSNFYNSK